MILPSSFIEIPLSLSLWNFSNKVSEVFLPGLDCGVCAMVAITVFEDLDDVDEDEEASGVAVDAALLVITRCRVVD